MSPRTIARSTPLLLVSLLVLTGAAAAAEPSDPSEPNHFIRRVNSGGELHNDYYGHPFGADRPYVTGQWGYVGGTTASTTKAVEGTTDDVLYQSARGGDFSYVFDNVEEEGTYEVRLYFNEWLYTTPGQRIFNVFAEGKLKLFRYDPFRYCGTPSSDIVPGVGTDRACVQVFEVEVTDGQLVIEWRKALGSAARAMVSAVEVSEVEELPLAGYVEVADQVGLVHTNVFDSGECLQSVATGSAWADYDGDDDIDLYVTNHGGPNRLYENQGSTEAGLPNFVDVAQLVGVDDPLGWGHGAVFIDYDNDGDQDLYVTNLGGNVLFHNKLVETGTADFIDVTSTAGIANAGRGVTAAWADYDGDSDLDLYVAKHFECMEPPFIQNSEDVLYRNEGDGTFTDVTDFLCPGGIAPCAATSGLGFSAAWVDIDEDADLDLYLANDNVQDMFHPNVLWRNDGPGVQPGEWVFTDVSVSSGANSNGNMMGLSSGDFDNDRDMDFAFSNVGPNQLLENLGNGTFLNVSAGAGIQRNYVRGIPIVGPQNSTENWGWGTAFFDHDNDGWLDLLFVNGYLNDSRPKLPSVFYWNKHNSTFRDIGKSSGLGLLGRVRNASIVDFDEDGFLDVFMNNYPDRGMGPFKTNGEFWLFHNQAVQMGNTHHWLKVTVEGTTSNHDAIGTRIWIRDSNVKVQVRDINSGSTHGGGDERAAYFGLGDNGNNVHVRIRWPTGQVQWLFNRPVDQHIHVVEPAP